VGGVLTRYLLDVQPALALVLTDIATTAANTVDYVHGPMGVQNILKNAVWYTPLTDGLGSERSELTTTGTIQASKHYDPFGQPYDALGTWIGSFAFTGEQRDSNGLQYHRARYYNTKMGTWAAQDIIEDGNRYLYASSNPINRVDHNGLQDCGKQMSDVRTPDDCAGGTTSPGTPNEFSNLKEGKKLDNGMVRVYATETKPAPLGSSVWTQVTPPPRVPPATLAPMVSPSTTFMRTIGVYDWSRWANSGCCTGAGVFSQLNPAAMTLASVQPLLERQTTGQRQQQEQEEEEQRGPCGKVYPNRLRPWVYRDLKEYFYESRQSSAELQLWPNRDNPYLYVVRLDGGLIIGNERAFRRERRDDRRMHHPDLVYDADVAYAGEISFNPDGTVMSWNRQSGHYQPSGDAQEVDCIKRIIERAPGWNLGSLPPQSPF
jgi:RHS repeat-associated protein